MMSRVEKLSVVVTPEMASKLHEAVADGRYASTSEVVREALDDWTARQSMRAEAAAELRKLWDKGVSSGESSPAEDAFSRIRARIEAATLR
jgi:antitoxin ParD1/3/4